MDDERVLSSDEGLDIKDKPYTSEARPPERQAWTRLSGVPAARPG